MESLPCVREFTFYTVLSMRILNLTRRHNHYLTSTTDNNFNCKNMSSYNFRYNLLNYLKRHYGTTRKYPLSPDYIKDLPVFDYVNARLDRNRIYVWGCVKTGSLGIKYVKQKRIIEYSYYPKRLGFAEKFEVTGVASGFGFSAFAVNSEDNLKVYGTGINTDSQVGYHAVREGKPLTVVFYPQPIALPFLDPVKSKVRKLAAGRAHLVILTDEGLFLLGSNAYGQCGRSVIIDENYSEGHYVHHIQNLDGKSIVDVVCGQDHTIALTKEGHVYSCGWGADGQTGLGHFNSVSAFTRVRGDIELDKVIKVSCRSDFTMALNDKGEVFGWGNTEYAQVMTTDNTQQISHPTYMKTCKDLGRIKDIASGGSCCLVLNENGQVFVWGFGLLGIGPQVQQSTKPILIKPQLFGLNDFNSNNQVVAVRCGLGHLAAITNQGDLYMWGRNRNGCLGLGNAKDQFFPLKVAIGGYVSDLACGLDHTIAICKSFVSN